MPKPIQIEAVRQTVFGISIGVRLYALCDDGSIWRSEREAKDASWRRCDEQVPQEK